MFHDYYSQQGLSCEMSYLNTIQTYHSRLFVLTRTGLHVASLQSWNKRLDMLVRFGMFHPAIEMALDLHDNKHTVAVSSLPVEPVKRHSLISQHLLSILDMHTKLVLRGHAATASPSADGDVTFTADLAKLCIRVCTHIHAIEHLIQHVYEDFVNSGIENVFVDEIVDEILKTEGDWDLSANPVLGNRICDLLVSSGEKGRLKLEGVIVRIDPSCLDINHIFGVCVKEGLVAALIFLYSVALKDFQGPIVEVLRAIDGKVGIMWGKKPIPELTYLLFFYMAMTFKGQMFPLGVRLRGSTDCIIQAKTQIYELVFSPGYYSYQGESFMIEGGTIPPFPYLVILLRADTTEFLKVLGIGFQDDSLNAEEISMQENHQGGMAHQGVISRQFILDAIFSVVEGRDFPMSDIVACYTFALRSLLKYSVFIYFDEELIYRLVTKVIGFVDEQSSHERESAVLGILESSSGQVTDFPTRLVTRDALQLVRICLDNKLLKAAQFFYCVLEQYDMIVDCCLSDPGQRADAFTILEELLSRDSLTYQQRWKIKDRFLALVDRFVRLSSDSTARLVQDFFPSMHIEIVDTALKHDESLLLKYMDSIATNVLGYSASDGNDKEFFESVEGGDYKRFPKELYHSHVRLMARFRPESVYRYIHFLTLAYRSSESPFSLDLLVDICKTNDILDASVFLLRKMSKFKEALDLVTMQYRTLFTHRNLCDLLEILRLGVSVCLESKDRDTWMTLFDVVVQCRDQYEFGIETPNSSSFPNLEPGSVPEALDGCLYVIDNITGHVPLNAILGRLIKFHPTPRLVDHRTLISSLLTNYHFERVLLEAACRIFRVDFYAHKREFMGKFGKPVLLTAANCGVCKSLGDDFDFLVVFGCTHVVHERCLVTQQCPKCTPSVNNVLGHLVANATDGHNSGHDVDDDLDARLEEFIRLSLPERTPFQILIDMIPSEEKIIMPDDVEDEITF